jgi:hypothetical protein
MTRTLRSILTILLVIAAVSGWALVLDLGARVIPAAGSPDAALTGAAEDWTRTRVAAAIDPSRGASLIAPLATGAAADLEILKPKSLSPRAPGIPISSLCSRFAI